MRGEYIVTNGTYYASIYKGGTTNTLNEAKIYDYQSEAEKAVNTLNSFGFLPKFKIQSKVEEVK